MSQERISSGMMHSGSAAVIRKVYLGVRVGGRVGLATNLYLGQVW